MEKVDIMPDRLDEQIMFALGASRAELLPSDERIDEKVNEIHMDNGPREALRGWIKLAVEATRQLILEREKARKLEEVDEILDEVENGLHALESKVADCRKDS